MTAFTITVVHKKGKRVFRISAQKDTIFIAFVQNRYQLGKEKIFLTKVAGRWASDCTNRHLVHQLIQGIELHMAAMA